MAFADAQIGGRVLHGSAPCRITLAGACVAGDLLGYASGWKRALATTGTAIQGRLVAGEDGAIGDVITAYREAVVDSRISGATAGNPIYGAEGTDNGKYTETAPNTTGDCDTILGVALDATTLLLFPLNRADSLSA